VFFHEIDEFIPHILIAWFNCSFNCNCML